MHTLSTQPALALNIKTLASQQKPPSPHLFPICCCWWNRLPWWLNVMSETILSLNSDPLPQAPFGLLLHHGGLLTGPTRDAAVSPLFHPTQNNNICSWTWCPASVVLSVGQLHPALLLVCALWQGSLRLKSPWTLLSQTDLRWIPESREQWESSGVQWAPVCRPRRRLRMRGLWPWNWKSSGRAPQ